MSEIVEKMWKIGDKIFFEIITCFTKREFPMWILGINIFFKVWASFLLFLIRPNAVLNGWPDGQNLSEVGVIRTEKYKGVWMLRRLPGTNQWVLLFVSRLEFGEGGL